eukprot:1092945-Rhodomonas_salina.1
MSLRCLHGYMSAMLPNRTRLLVCLTCLRADISCIPSADPRHPANVANISCIPSADSRHPDNGGVTPAHAAADR